jgi:hypothetical protein
MFSSAFHSRFLGHEKVPVSKNKATKEYGGSRGKAPQSNNKLIVNRFLYTLRSRNNRRTQRCQRCSIGLCCTQSLALPSYLACRPMSYIFFVFFFSLELQPQFGHWPTSMKLSVSLRFTRS